MSLLSIFSKEAPQIGALTFDAVLEEITSKSVTITEFPIEFGANVNDHRILNPNRYIMTGAVSDTPLGFGLTDAALIGTGLLGNAIGGRAGGIAQSIAIYALAGSEKTRSATAWATLTAIMNSGEPFSLQTGLEILDNMVITRLDTRRTPANEGGLEFIAELRELQIVYTSLIKAPIESALQLPENDTATTQAAPEQPRGQVNLQEAS